MDFLFQKNFVSFPILKKINNIKILSDDLVFPMKWEKSPRNKLNEQKNSIPVFMDFISFLQVKNYVNLSPYERRISLFFSFLKDKNLNIQEIIDSKEELILRKEILAYENFVSKKTSLKEIEVITGYSYLRTIRLFVNFLRENGIVHYKYQIPEHLRGKGTRSNAYVASQEMILLLDSIIKYSKNVLRDLSVFLLIVDIGCRNIEVCNIKLSDLNLIERTVNIFCHKSGERKLNISEEAISVLKDYLSIRNLYQPIDDSLFVKSDGNPIVSKNVYQIFYKANQHSFDKMIHSPMSFRHTYITNALENNYPFDQVSKTAGHKHWISTFYYLHRSKALLLKNTLNHSPLKNKEI
jgi:site-specific recombinase XerD